MLNIDEMFIYIIIIIGLILIIHLYNKIHPKLYPIWEGLTDSNDTNTKDTSVNKTPTNGLNSGSIGFNQDITGLIAVSEVELNINKYSEQYLEILNNLKEVYARRALTALLLPIQNNSSIIYNISSANIYKNGIDIVEKIIPIINKSNVPSFSSTSKYTSGMMGNGGGGGGKGSSGDNSGQQDDSEDTPATSSWW